MSDNSEKVFMFWSFLPGLAGMEMYVRPGKRAGLAFMIAQHSDQPIPQATTVNIY